MDGFHFHYENLYKHSVTEEEALEAFADEYLVDIEGRKGSNTILGRTESGRILELSYKENRDGSIYIFHAMDARTGQPEIYRRLSI